MCCGCPPLSLTMEMLYIIKYIISVIINITQDLHILVYYNSKIVPRATAVFLIDFVIKHNQSHKIL